jgi:superfamily II DNA helicase RecQ
VQYRFFTIPIREPDEGMAELNRFLAGHRIMGVDRQFVQDASNSAWAICISFDSGEASSPGRSASMARRGKVDFKDILSEPEFAVFARLRALRKEKADAEGVPAYAVFTNEQLAEMVQKRTVSAASLREIAGIGEARVEKYGDAFLAVVKEAALPERAVEDREP